MNGGAFATNLSAGDLIMIIQISVSCERSKTPSVWIYSLWGNTKVCESIKFIESKESGESTESSESTESNESL